jgi:hypothetical protein
MPLKEGTSQEVISDNIEEVMRSFQKTGKIGSNIPKNKKDALKMAEAIAFAKARRTADEMTKPKIEESSKKLNGSK